MKKNINFKSTAILIFLAISAMPLLAQPVTRQGTGDRQRQGQGQQQRQQMTEASVKERVTKISENLECTDEQTKKMVDFEVAQFNAGQKKRQELAGNREAMMNYMREVNTLRQKKYAEILTSDQLKKYNQFMEERRQRRPNQGENSQSRGRGRGGN